MPPALSHTNSEIVPGCLPWMSSCCGVVTIASAMSGTVSDTREIVEPTLRIVDRPTSRSIVVASGELAAGPGEIEPAEPLNDADCCAWGVATRITMMYTTSAASFAGPRAPLMVSLPRQPAYGLRNGQQLSDDFGGALVAPDDFNGRHRRDGRRVLGHRTRRRPARARDRTRRVNGRRLLHAEEHGRPHARRFGRADVERVAQRELNLPFVAREREALGLLRIHEQRDDGHLHRLVLVLVLLHARARRDDLDVREDHLRRRVGLLIRRALRGDDVHARAGQ